MADWTIIDSMERVPKGDFPMENYLNIGAAVVKACAQEYLESTHFLWTIYDEKKEELIKQSGWQAKQAIRVLETKRSMAERSIETCMTFFKSERFHLFMPNTDQRWFISALKEKAKRTCNSRRRM